MQNDNPQLDLLSKPERRARAIAFYLPQYHPIPENDLWWGKGFTEWTNTARAKPLFRGHYQPHVPADLGFYDLRVSESRIAQADMAREYGIEAFCYWHYWFAGDRLLERPFQEVLRSGEPDFPFCLGWANHTWSGIWYGAPNTVLKEQTYPGLHDHEAHFYSLLEAFQDPRYLTVDGKPFFLLFRPRELPDSLRVTDFWRELAQKEGLKGLHIVAHSEDETWLPQEHGFDAATISNLNSVTYFRKNRSLLTKIRSKLKSHPKTASLANRWNSKPVNTYYYKDIAPKLVVKKRLEYEYYPCVVPNWDNTPRSGQRGSVLRGSTPELFRAHLKQALAVIEPLPPQHRIIMARSWNEWAEGNHFEPDLRYGHSYLKVLRDQIMTMDVSEC